ncbi:hypothetical protein [Fusibacter sp. JL216-2]|uniref:hypothetical protein n=1 Tax=Fusibacter sp. JL216-2 TaxID=3071453 RepID=UPI003D34C5A0
MIENAIKEFDPKNYNKKTVIGEFSGRDSVAAILKAFEDEDIDYILPVATFAGTEYGDFNVIYKNYKHLQKRVKDLYGDKKVLYPLIEYSREDIWALMNGRLSGELSRKFGFYSPCIGCHLYFHLTKLNFARPLSGIILSGERESHDGRIKVNQLGESLDIYQEVIASFDCQLRMPLRHMDDGHEVESLIGWEWKEGLAHPDCVLSRNYRSCDGKAVYDKNCLERLLQEYVKPAGVLVGKYIVEDQKADINALKKEVLALI